MKLNPGERSIMAYFPSSTKAAAAKAALAETGITEVSLDRVSRYGVTNNWALNSAIGGQAETQTGLVLLESDTDQFSDNDARILMGADPSVSGITAEGYGTAGGKAFLLAVVANDENVEKAVAVLKEHGASV